MDAFFSSFASLPNVFDLQKVISPFSPGTKTPSVTFILSVVINKIILPCLYNVDSFCQPHEAARFHSEKNVSERLDSRRGRLQGSSTLSKNLPALRWSKNQCVERQMHDPVWGRSEGERTEAHRFQCASTVKIALTNYSNVARHLSLEILQGAGISVGHSWEQPSGGSALSSWQHSGKASGEEQTLWPHLSGWQCSRQQPIRELLSRGTQRGCTYGDSRCRHNMAPLNQTPH